MKNGIKSVADQTHIDFYTCFGDIIWRVQSDGDFEKGKAEMIAATKIINDAFGNNDQIRMIGNHDPNAEGATGAFTAYQLNAFFGIYTNMFTEKRDYSYPGSSTDTSYQGIGFTDFPRQKIRFIALDTSVYAQNESGQPVQGSTQYRFGVQQAYWLCYALDLSDKGSDAENWNIIVASHVSPNISDHTNEIGKYITPVFGAYETGGTWSLSSYSYNFSGKNSAKLSMYINGHAHKYFFHNVKVVDGSGTVQSILPMADLYMPNALPARDYPSIDGITYTKTPNSGESTAFEIITIDPESKTVYAYHYGAGIDIIMHYDATSEASYNTSLTSAVWSSDNTDVATVSNGVVTPVSNGYAMIWAKSEADNCIECWNYHSTI